MQKIGVYLTLLVIGAMIGASVVTFVTMNQNPSVEEQVKVTIQGMEYQSSGSVLKIELLNDAPEKNLEGNVVVFQDGNQWTSEVTWYYTGYGEAEVTCDSINETQNFRVTYTENNPEATYLDREIKWTEISATIGFMETSELTINQMTFTAGDSENGQILVELTNSGTSAVTVSMVKVNGATQTNVTGDTTHGLTFPAGDSGTITIEQDWTAGNKYSVTLFSSDGTLVGAYTDTA
jgi:hypothetical protein